MSPKSYASVLAFDTAMGGCGVGLYTRRGTRLFETFHPMERGQSERLVPEIQTIINRAGLEFGDLDAIVTTLGPGAFAGLRIGLSAAKAFGLALEIPVFGVTTLEALAFHYAQEHKPKAPFLAVIETKRRDFYYQVFQADGGALSAPAAAAAQAVLRDAGNLGAVACIGDGAQRLCGEVGAAAETFPFAGYSHIPCGRLARSLAEDEARGLFTTELHPLYLREADVTLSKKIGRTLEGGHA